MGLHRTTDPHAFLEACGDAVAARAVEHNVIGSVARREADTGASRCTYLWLEGDDGVRALCLWYPGEPVALSGASPSEARALATALLDEPPDDDPEPTPGVRGPVAAARAFAEVWAARTGRRVEREMAQGVYVCRRVLPPEGVPGAPRPARADDVAVALERFVAFGTEAGVGPPHREAVERVVSGGRLWWWVDAARSEAPVAMASCSPASTGVARLGGVHTPVEHRRRGYASALTAHVTSHVLAAGHLAMLHTDLDNPTSNGIYAAIGYERVGDSLALWFGSA